jgi:hypothetical protein
VTSHTQRQIAQIKEHPEQSDEVLDEMNFLKNFDEAGGKLAHLSLLAGVATRGAAPDGHRG